MAIPCKIVTVEGETDIIATEITAPASVTKGGTISGTATFENVGDASGFQLCRVEANGITVGSEELELAPSAIGHVNYSFIATDVGTYTICPHPNP